MGRVVAVGIGRNKGDLCRDVGRLQVFANKELWYSAVASRGIDCISIVVKGGKKLKFPQMAVQVKEEAEAVYAAA